MKRILTLSMLVTFYASALHAQNDSTHYYLEGEFTSTFDRLDKMDTSSIVEVNIWFIKGETDTLEQDYKIGIDLKHITTKAEDIKLLTKYVFYSKEELEENDSLVAKIQIQVQGDTNDLDKSFLVQVKSDDFDYDELKHQKIITLERPSEESSSTKELAAAFKKVDTTIVGQLYLTEMDQVQSYDRLESTKRRELKKAYLKKIEGKSTKRREKCFRKHYAPNDKGLIDIDVVRFVINEGRISSIAVGIKEDPGYYINKGPVTLTNFYNRRFYKLHYSGSDPELQGSVIVLKDFMNYVPSGDRTYFPSKDEFTLPDKDTIAKKLNLIGSPNTFFDARVYTDLKGLNGEENALVQTDVNAQFIANSSNMGRSHLTFLQFVNLGFSASKFDSKFDTLNMASFDNREGVDLLSLTQRANATFRVEIDLLRYSRVHDAYFRLGHQIYHTKVQANVNDSTKQTKNIFTPAFCLTLGGTLFATEMIRADFRFPVKFAYSYDQPFVNYDRNWEFLLTPEIEIAVNLQKEDKEDPEKKRAFVFARIRYFDMPQFKGNNYWQLQTGVEIPLSSLFK